MSPRRLSQSQVDTILHLFDTGSGYAQISRALQVPFKTVVQVCAVLVY